MKKDVRKDVLNALFLVFLMSTIMSIGIYNMKKETIHRRGFVIDSLELRCDTLQMMINECVENYNNLANECR